MTEEELEREFLNHAEIARSLPKQAPDLMLIAYALYKQGLHGDNDSERPQNNSDIVETFMHDSWNKLKGMTKTEAKRKYIAFIQELQSGKSVIDYTQL